MPSKISLEDVDAVEIARQLTLQEFDMFLVGIKYIVMLTDAEYPSQRAAFPFLVEKG